VGLTETWVKEKSPLLLSMKKKEKYEWLIGLDF
jgi:hypothetical protein